MLSGILLFFSYSFPQGSWKICLVFNRYNPESQINFLELDKIEVVDYANINTPLKVDDSRILSD